MICECVVDEEIVDDGFFLIATCPQCGNSTVLQEVQ